MLILFCQWQLPKWQESYGERSISWCSVTALSCCVNAKPLDPRPSWMSMSSNRDVPPPVWVVSGKATGSQHLDLCDQTTAFPYLVNRFLLNLWVFFSTPLCAYIDKLSTPSEPSNLSFSFQDDPHSPSFYPLSKHFLCRRTTHYLTWLCALQSWEKCSIESYVVFKCLLRAGDDTLC